MMKGLKENCYATAHICGKPCSDYWEQTCSISPLSREIYVRFRKGAQKSSKYDQELWQRLIREEWWNLKNGHLESVNGMRKKVVYCVCQNTN